MRPPVAYYRQWRHEGEEGAVAVYSAASWGMPVVAIATACALCFFLLHLKYPAILLLLVAYAAVPDLANARKAVILTPKSVRYRPTFGGLQEVPIANIARLKRKRMTELAGWNAPIDVAAVELVLTNGQSIFLSLNLRGGEELLERLCSMTKLPCSQS